VAVEDQSHDKVRQLEEQLKQARADEARLMAEFKNYRRAHKEYNTAFWEKRRVPDESPSLRASRTDVYSVEKASYCGTLAFCGQNGLVFAGAKR
jgi:hypothetical protein